MPWTLVGPDSQILAVHAAFVNFNKILFYGGDQHDPVLATAHKVDATRLFDCTTFAVTAIPSPPFDAFCSGHAMTVTGAVVVAGGTGKFNQELTGLHHDHFAGLRDTAVFVLEKAGPIWRTTADLNPGERAPLCEQGQDPERDQCATREDFGKTGGRWYPTLLTLANGDVLALSGHPGAGDREHNNYIPEVFTPLPMPRGAWHRLGSYTNPAENQLFGHNRVTDYPRAHLLPTGDVLVSSPAGGQTVTLTVNKTPWSGSFQPICKFTPEGYGGYDTTSILLPLLHENGYAARVLLCGDQQPWVLDLTKWRPGVTPVDSIQWQPAGPRTLAGSPRRLTGNAVLLPTGEVVVLGGIREATKLDKDAVMTPELFNPFTNTWSTPTGAHENATVPRNYHSVAVLMPDGRVFTAGSDHNAGRGTGPGGAAELRIELYEPWYHGRKNRPKILAAPDRWTTGETFSVRTTQAPPTQATHIIRVALLRCSTSTHAFNPDQRYISLPFKHKGGDILEVTAPSNGNVMPSGMYFLFTVNNKGLPSAGITLYVSTDPQSDTEIAWKNLIHGQR